MIRRLDKKGQEEIVGFVVIIVIVGVIILILLGFLLNSPDESAVESYEVESFIDSMLQYTTNCESQLEYLSVQKLIAYCENEGICLDGEDSCDILNSTIKEIIENGWDVNEQSAVKAYEFNIFNEENQIFLVEKGNKTSSYKGSYQDFVRSGKEYKVSLTIYE